MRNGKSKAKIHIVGGGLAGCEAAYQALQMGAAVNLYEMRPTKMTPAHKTGNLAELVCSNSLKSMDPNSATGQLKKELLYLNSLIIEAAVENQVPAGQALAVDRERFSEYIYEKLMSFDQLTCLGEEITEIPLSKDIPANEAWIICTGPLTSEPLAQHLVKRLNVSEQLYFYDAIAPTIETDSINMDLCFRSSRYDRGDDDYINIPFTKEEYDNLVAQITVAERVPLHAFEKTQYFEACLPIEVMIDRGPETLRFGPMKPVGLRDPKTQKTPYAVIQLRQENREGTMVSMVGFQTKMKWNEQEKVFRSIPALKKAHFFRFGTVHRNTYVHGPQVLSQNLSLLNSPNVFMAGQITGVEGYSESTAIGLLAGRCATSRALGRNFMLPPPATVIGSLLNYVTRATTNNYQPMNANMGLLPEPPPKAEESIVQGKPRLSKADKKSQKISNAELALQNYLSAIDETIKA